MKKIIFVISICFCLFFVQSCELFVIKGKKIVIEEESVYTQSTPLGVVTIFINELNNDNILAASDLLIKSDGKFLTATEKYEIMSELSRMKRFLDGKKIINSKLDTNSGTVNVILELSPNNKATFSTVKNNSSYFILNFWQE